MAENRVRMARTSSGAVFLMWFGCAVLFVCGFLFGFFWPSFLAQLLAALAFCQGHEGFLKSYAKWDRLFSSKMLWKFLPTRPVVGLEEHLVLTSETSALAC